MNVWDFANSSPFTAFCLALVAATAFGTLCDFILKFVNRFIRHWNISVKGWPPEHLDADGDFKPVPKKDESPAEEAKT